MPHKTPSWWYLDEPTPIARLLQPAGFLYDRITRWRMSATPAYRPDVPVICVGNFTAGGAGKTPTALAICRLLKGMGKTPVFLTRGYGGSIVGPHAVDPTTDDAADVGDEPLLLAREAATVVARDRAAGAKFLPKSYPAADILILDDGFQNPSLPAAIRIAVVDAHAGIGNGLCIPAGPLRAGLDVQIPRADAILLLSPAEPGFHRAARLPGIPVNGPPVILRARLAPSDASLTIAGRRVVAFAGIGRPDKFFAMLRMLEADVRATMPYADHHRYDQGDARKLLELARSHGAVLATTAKDWVRLIGKTASGELRELAENSVVCAVDVQFDAPDLRRLNTLLSAIW